MSAKKVSLSIPVIFYKIAKERANIGFGGKFSSYIVNLISKDNQEAIKREYKKIQNGTEKDNLEQMKKDFTKKSS